jgi:hypothetical protein
MSKDFTCPTCGKVKFKDLNIRDAECKGCGDIIKKSSIKSGFILYLAEMPKYEFKEKYCKECTLNVVCKEKGCYEDYYVNGESFFWVPQNFDYPAITLKQFTKELLKLPQLLMSYVIFSVMGSEESLKAEPRDYIEDLYMELITKAGYNIDFLYKFYVEGWYESKSKYNFVSPEPKPVLFSINAG